MRVPVRFLALVYLSLIPLLPALVSGAQAAEAAKPYSPDPHKVLRYAFEVAETGMDPHRVSDVYSTIAHNAIFDSPLRSAYWLLL